MNCVTVLFELEAADSNYIYLPADSQSNWKSHRDQIKAQLHSIFFRMRSLSFLASVEV
jgi:hypothetical protein